MPQDDEQTFETQHHNAGFAQRPAPPDPFGLGAGPAELPEEMTPEELDARQAEISEQRRKGPPLPEEEQFPTVSGLGFGSGDVEPQRAGPTEVVEPPDKD
jgi:hypothetical protein